MNPDDLILPPQQPKKRIFKPVQPRRRNIVPKREPEGDDGAGLEMLRRFQEKRDNRKLDGPMESSFADNSCQTTASAKQYGTTTTGYSGYSNSRASKSSDGNQKALCLPSPDISTNAIVSSNSDASEAKIIRIEKDYVEPWDYDGHYPTNLPLRRPYSGNPEILNELEFGKNQSSVPDESSKTHATKLGLLAEYENPDLFLVQLPDKFPIPRQLLLGKRPDTGGSSIPMGKADPSTTGKGTANRLPASGQGSSSARGNIARASRPVMDQTKSKEGFSGGHIGKIQVYKSGKVKLKVGETLFDVAPGICFDNMDQDLVALNKREKTFCEIGDLEKKMLVSADVDFLLDSIVDSK